MIDFRYHVVSIVAVFLALALGLFIGSTTLRGTVGADISQRTDKLFKQNNELNAQKNQLAGQLGDGQAFDRALLPYAVADRLSGQSVAVVSAPGTDAALRSNIVSGMQAAGATIAADVRLKNGLLDPQQDQFLAGLAGRVAIPGHSFAAGESGAQRALGLLSAVLGDRPQRAPVPKAAADRVLTTFEAGGLLSVSGPTPTPASLAVLIVPTPSVSSDQAGAAAQQQSDQLLAQLAVDLDKSTVGAVVAGPVGAAVGPGVLQLIRADGTASAAVSTVDGADLPSGAIATVMALAEQADGGDGSYGSAQSADRPLPTASPTPSP